MVMLILEKPPPLPKLDRLVFDMVVPKNHYLRQVVERIDFERFRPRLAEAYSLDMGRPAIDPVRMFKILFLCYQYKLSDRQVMKRTETDVAFRWFLDLGLKEKVPNHTDDTKFRNRIGAERFQQVFQDLVAQAREAGLVKDRLRLKDATHMFADVADLQPLALAAQVRDRLMQMAKPFFPDWVNEQQARIETLRQTTAEFPDNERLAARVEYLRQMAAELRKHVASLPPASPADQGKRQRLDKAVAVADKLLADRDDPKAKDRLASAIDSDGRVGKHGSFYVGFLLDVAMDADSEIITNTNVLAANGAEAADAIKLIQQEEAAHGNDVEGISLDGIGYNGPVLRELTNPDGLNLDVTVPPPQAMERKTFGPERFPLTVLEDGGNKLTCPNGQSAQQRERNEKDTGWKFVFKASQCASCPLRQKCLENPEGPSGRTVIKNDYEAEYGKVAAKAKTREYKETRRTHPKIERKLNEMSRHHEARRARYRGLPKARTQGVLTAFVVNVKRIVKLLAQKINDAASALPVRAEGTAV
jgi:transposase